jgi:hypothetical protein
VFNANTKLTLSTNLFFDGSTKKLGSLNMTAGGILQIGGSITTTYIGTFTPGSGTIEYNSTGNQTVTNGMGNYSNLILAGSGIKTLGGNITVNGTLSMEGSATFSLGGTYILTFGSSACLQYMGNVAQTSGPEFPATWNGSGGIKIENPYGVTLTSEKNIGSNPLTIGSTISNSVLNDGGYQLISSGTLNLTSGTFKLGGTNATTWPNFGNVNISSGTTVEYASSAIASQTIAAVNYHNLTSSSSGTRTLASSGTIGIAGTFTPGSNSYTVTGSTVNFNGTNSQTIPAFNYNNLTSNSSGARNLASSGTIGIAGTFTPGGNTYTVSGSTVSFNGSSAQSIPSFTFNNLTTSGSGIKSIAAGSQVTVEGSLNTNGLLSVESDNSNNGSLIVDGISTGNVTYNRYVYADPRWYITSAPVLVASGFNTDNGSHIKPGSGDFDFATYDEAANDWIYETSIPSSLTQGKGYLTRLSEGYTNIKYTGTLNGSVSVPVEWSNPDNGWNAVGNPYTSAITVGGFLASNTTILDPAYQALYVWNQEGTLEQGDYYAITNSGYTYTSTLYPVMGSTDYIQAGQGFVVHAASVGNVQFSTSMQTHQPAVSLKNAEISWPGLTLLAQYKGGTSGTVVCFSPEMTTGLDKGYDAGLLSISDFNVYTALVSPETRNTAFTVQCLPDNRYASLVVPVGIDVPAGGQVTFRAAGMILPPGVYPVLEDKLLKNKTVLQNENDSCVVNFTSAYHGTGRFTLGFEIDATTSAREASLPVAPAFSAWSTGQQIVISGNPGPDASVSLFDLNGRKTGEYPLLQENQNTIPTGRLVDGIYLLRIEGKNSRQVLKVPVVTTR